MCSLSLYLNNSPPPNDSSPLSPALEVVAALSAITCYCKHSQWISLCLTMSTGFNYWWMSRMSAGSTSFLSEPNPFLVLCNIIPHCQSALINILHIQHLWSVFHCSSSGEMSVAALQMDIGASPKTIQFPHTTSLTCILKTPDLDHLRLERKLPEHKAGALVYTLKHIIALLSLQVEGLL